jgi:hypothetical protein
MQSRRERTSSYTYALVITWLSCELVGVKKKGKMPVLGYLDIDSSQSSATSIEADGTPR